MRLRCSVCGEDFPDDGGHECPGPREGPAVDGPEDVGPRPEPGVIRSPQALGGITTSDPCDQVFAALAIAQAKSEALHKDREVKVATRTGPGYSYSYATLAAVIGASADGLAAAGLAVITSVCWIDFKPHGGRGLQDCVATRIVHGSGQWLETVVPMLDDMQALGSQMTYSRRYGIMGCLNQAPDDDDDGTAGERGYDRPGKPSGPARGSWESDRPGVVAALSRIGLTLEDVDARMVADDTPKLQDMTPEDRDSTMKYLKTAQGQAAMGVAAKGDG